MRLDTVTLKQSYPANLARKEHGPGVVPRKQHVGLKADQLQAAWLLIPKR